MNIFQFEAYPKIPRYKSEVIVTEKIDGTNAQVAWFPVTSGEALDRAMTDPFCLRLQPAFGNGDSVMALYAGSRSRWLRPDKSADNFGFAAWVQSNAEELLKLGEGRHFGEWYGAGIQRGYGLDHKRFALFNTQRWNEENPNRPACCEVVPVLAKGTDEDADVENVLLALKMSGSKAVPGYLNPEGVVIYHAASRNLYKRTFEQDKGKWQA